MPEKPERPRRERTENAAMRREQLIDATLRSVVRNGLAGTTLATVADEADLSQGVAVFYFKTKQKLLAAALRAAFNSYRAIWEAAFSEANDDPVAQIAALVQADFDERTCNHDALTIWYAFWGEFSAIPLYAEISAEIDHPRIVAMQDACAALLQALGDDERNPELVAAGIDALTDGLWQGLYVSPEDMTREMARHITAQHLAGLFPTHAERFRALIAPARPA